DDNDRGNVYYRVYAGQAVILRAYDFQEVCDRVTDENLSHVRFSLPAASRGLLVSKYDPADGSYSARATSTNSYYRLGSGNRRQIDDLWFVADKDYAGLVELEITMYSTGGDSFESMLTFDVSTPSAGAVRYSTGSLPVNLQAGDFRQAVSSVFSRELKYIRFTSLPEAAAGKLMVDYEGPGSGSEARMNTRYSVDDAPAIGDLWFVPRAGFAGETSFRFEAVDALGTTTASTVTITVDTAAGTSHFGDTGWHTWAEPAIEFLYRYNIVQGTGDNSFGPGISIRRGDFVLMLHRAFDFGDAGTYSFADVPMDSYYAAAIAAAQERGVVKGDDLGSFRPQNTMTRQDAMVMLYRAMNAAGSPIPMASASVLSGYQDSAAVSDYATEAVSAMVAQGIVTGDTDGRLNPHMLITRAEMAMILYRALTR
ncbi:MAG: S-layer homology domain-containing protein, partial [Clostridia bacterium]|nr:S-layer homology domain-containing protein [Clostridia bacterium]